MFCTKCAHAIPDGAKFCPLCGTVVAAAPQPSPEAAAAQPAAGPRVDLHAATAYASGLVCRRLRWLSYVQPFAFQRMCTPNR